MSTVQDLRASDLPHDLRAALRGLTRSRRRTAVVGPTVVIPDDAGLYGGGSRSDFYLVRIADGMMRRDPLAASSFWDVARRGRALDLAPGFLVAEHVRFCGKDLGFRLYVHPDDLAKMLPASV